MEDVKKEFFEIASVSRADLETAGFNASKVDDDTMERLASKMGDDYLEQLYWTSLKIIAEYLEIPKKKWTRTKKPNAANIVAEK